MGEGKKRGVSMERSTRGMEEISSVGQSLLNQKTIFINILYNFTRFRKKYNEIQVKNMDLNNQKMRNHTPYTVLIFKGLLKLIDSSRTYSLLICTFE